MCAAVACHANDDVSGAATHSQTSGGDSSTSEGDQRTLRVDGPIEFCARSPQRQAFGASPLFHFRSITTLTTTAVQVPDQDGIDIEAILPFTVQLSAETSGVEFAAEGRVRVEENMVPSSIYELDEAEGWETAVYLADQSRGDPPYFADLQVAHPSGASTFGISSAEVLDAEKRLDVVTFVLDYENPGSAGAVATGPCRLEDAVVDRTDIKFAEGSVEFHTRPAFWKSFSGFTVLARGDVAGISFEVDSYWDLEYATSDMGSDVYGVGPVLAVRFPEQADGTCILVVEPDVYDPEGSYVARLLDCEQVELLPLAIESIAFVPGGGE
ncbi:MAG: hypothetical protein K1X67_20310, partial [Fimbriimonadaceae bacterium]|nr:hypothetical protein [Fimbriimonadaceae bacterium]